MSISSPCYRSSPVARRGSNGLAVLVSGLVGWGQVDQYLSPCSLRVPEKLSRLSSLEGSYLVPMR
jgi:hypothetical protein